MAGAGHVRQQARQIGHIWLCGDICLVSADGNCMLLVAKMGCQYRSVESRVVEDHICWIEVWCMGVDNHNCFDSLEEGATKFIKWISKFIIIVKNIIGA